MPLFNPPWRNSIPPTKSFSPGVKTHEALGESREKICCICVHRALIFLRGDHVKMQWAS